MIEPFQPIAAVGARQLVFSFCDILFLFFLSTNVQWLYIRTPHPQLFTHSESVQLCKSYKRDLMLSSSIGILQKGVGRKKKKTIVKYTEPPPPPIINDGNIICLHTKRKKNKLPFFFLLKSLDMHMKKKGGATCFLHSDQMK